MRCASISVIIKVRHVQKIGIDERGEKACTPFSYFIYDFYRFLYFRFESGNFSSESYYTPRSALFIITSSVFA